MPENFILSIVKIEGLGDMAKSECCLNDESDEHFKISLKSLPISFNIQNTETIKLCICDTESKTIIASLSFNIGILPCEWFYWLPLFLSADNLITELPMKISLPRILLGVNKEILLPTVNEISENSETNEEDLAKIEAIFGQSADNELHEFKLNLIQDTQSTDSCNKEESQIPISYYRKIIKNLEKEVKRQKEIGLKKCRELQTQVEWCKEEIEVERKYRIDMQEKFEHCTMLYENMRKREESLIKIIGKLRKSVELVMESPLSLGIIPTKEDKTPKLFLNDTLTLPSTLDKKVNDLLSRLKLSGFMRKSKDINYLIGAKPITLCLKNGQVYCKNGSPLDSYIFKSCKPEIENFLRSRACPSKNPRSLSRSPLSTCRTPGISTQKFLKF